MFPLQGTFVNPGHRISDLLDVELLAPDMGERSTRLGPLD